MSRATRVLRHRFSVTLYKTSSLKENETLEDMKKGAQDFLIIVLY